MRHDQHTSSSTLADVRCDAPAPPPGPAAAAVDPGPAQPLDHHRLRSALVTALLLSLAACEAASQRAASASINRSADDLAGDDPFGDGHRPAAVL